MRVFKGGPPGKLVVIYRYAPSRSGDVAANVLSGYAGYCQCDGYVGYDQLERPESGIRLVGCFAHAGRYFVKVIEARYLRKISCDCGACCNSGKNQASVP